MKNEIRQKSKPQLKRKKPVDGSNPSAHRARATPFNLHSEDQKKIITALTPGFWHLSKRDESAFDIESISDSDRRILNLNLRAAEEKKIADLILAGKVDPALNIQTPDFSAPLLVCAAQMKSWPIMRALLKMGADVNAKTVGDNPRSAYEVSLVMLFDDKNWETDWEAEEAPDSNSIAHELKRKGADPDHSEKVNFLNTVLVKELSNVYHAFKRNLGRFTQTYPYLNGIDRDALERVNWAIRQGASNAHTSIGDAELTVPLHYLMVILSLNYSQIDTPAAEEALAYLKGLKSVKWMEGQASMAGEAPLSLIQLLTYSSSGYGSPNFSIQEYQDYPASRGDGEEMLKLTKDALMVHYMQGGGNIGRCITLRNKPRPEGGKAKLAVEDPKTWGDHQTVLDFCTENNWPQTLRAIMDKGVQHVPIVVRERHLSIAHESLTLSATAGSLPLAKAFYGPETFREWQAKEGDTPLEIMDTFISAVTESVRVQGKVLVPVSRSGGRGWFKKGVIDKDLERLKEKDLIQRLTLFVDNAQAHSSKRVQALSGHLLRTACDLAMECEWDDLASFCFKKGVDPQWGGPTFMCGLEGRCPIILPAIVKGMQKTIKAAWPKIDGKTKVFIPMDVRFPHETLWPDKTIAESTVGHVQEMAVSIDALVWLKAPDLYREVKGTTNVPGFVKKFASMLGNECMDLSDHFSLLPDLIRVGAVKKWSQDNHQSLLLKLADQEVFEVNYGNDDDAPKSQRSLEALRIVCKELGPNGDVLGNPLQKAIYTSNSVMAQILLEEGADVNAVDSNGDTTFHYLARVGERSGEAQSWKYEKAVELSKLLMNHGLSCLTQKNHQNLLASEARAKVMHSGMVTRDSRMDELIKSLEEKAQLHEITKSITSVESSDAIATYRTPPRCL